MKRKTKILVGAALFALIAVCGYIAERVERNAFIEEPVIREDNAFYSDETTVSQTTDKININTAEREELSKLHGIGGALADRIIGYRQSHGGFTAVEEIMNVPGISENKFNDIKDDICIE